MKVLGVSLVPALALALELSVCGPTKTVPGRWLMGSLAVLCHVAPPTALSVAAQGSPYLLDGGQCLCRALWGRQATSFPSMSARSTAVRAFRTAAAPTQRRLAPREASLDTTYEAQAQVRRRSQNRMG